MNRATSIGCRDVECCQLARVCELPKRQLSNNWLGRYGSNTLRRLFHLAAARPGGRRDAGKSTSLGGVLANASKPNIHCSGVGNTLRMADLTDSCLPTEARVCAAAR
jgi:hypothetical protein